VRLSPLLMEAAVAISEQKSVPIDFGLAVTNYGRNGVRMEHGRAYRSGLTGPTDRSFFGGAKVMTAINEPRPDLNVSGERWDAQAPPLQSTVSNGWTDDLNHWFITNGINLPSLGCWKITGCSKNTELSFVVWVTQ
jgi:hypothetical protein